MTRAKVNAPVIWAVVCTDVDGKRYVFEMAPRRSGARTAAKIWLKNDKWHGDKGRCRRKYTVVRYVPAGKVGRGKR